MQKFAAILVALTVLQLIALNTPLTSSAQEEHVQQTSLPAVATTLVARAPTASTATLTTSSATLTTSSATLTASSATLTVSNATLTATTESRIETRSHTHQSLQTLIPPAVPPHADRNPKGCDLVVAQTLLDDWGAIGKKIVCGDGGMPSEIEHRLPHWEDDKPQFRVYHGVDLSGYFSAPLPWVCGEGASGEKAYREREVVHVQKPILLRTGRFDIQNPYEGLHSHLGVYLILRLLNISATDVQFAFDDAIDRYAERNSMVLWNAANRGAYPHVFKKEAPPPFPTPRRYGIVIHVDALLRTKSLLNIARAKPISLSVATDHSCKSHLFREAIAWMRGNFNVTAHGLPAGAPVRVLWSSRRPMAGGIRPSRMMDDEEGFLTALRNALGEGYEVESVDFAKLLPGDAMAKAAASDVLVGVHGAGLTWGAHLPRHGGIVELFGGDRTKANRHYHNLASLADLHYKSFNLRGKKRVQWFPEVVGDVARAIRAMPLRTMSEPR